MCVYIYTYICIYTFRLARCGEEGEATTYREEPSSASASINGNISSSVNGNINSNANINVNSNVNNNTGRSPRRPMLCYAMRLYYMLFYVRQLHTI